MQLRTHSSFFDKGLPIQKVVNIQRANLLKYKEIKAGGRLPVVRTYHPSVVRVDKTIIKELLNYGRLASSKHPFDATPVYAHRQPPNYKSVINSKYQNTVHIYIYLNVPRQQKLKLKESTKRNGWLSLLDTSTTYTSNRKDEEPNC